MVYCPVGCVGAGRVVGGAAVKHGGVVGIVGPTATGKTAVGIELAKELGGEVVSADSMAVYKLMNVGTAKPTSEQLGGVPLPLVDVAWPDEEFSVATFKRLAEEAIKGIVDRGRVPLLVGGTGLYVKAVTGGLSIPAVGPDRALRETLRGEAEVRGNRHLLERLRAVDPVTAGRLHANDLNRIIRALEVYTLSGTPISQFHRTGGAGPVPFEVRLFGLTMSRFALYSRIEARIDEQIEAGLVNEVKALLGKGYSPDTPAMKGLGYKQIAGYLLGRYDFPTAVALLKRDTRRFAKRQMTWFRADSRIEWIDVGGRTPAGIRAEITGLLKIKA